MRHQKSKIRLHRPRAASKLLLRNLATSLVIYEKIQTTSSKAKAVQSLMEKLINAAKNKGESLAIRMLQEYMDSELGSKKIMEDLIKRYAERKSGFTRITPIKFRAGDAAPIVQIQFVE